MSTGEWTLVLVLAACAVIGGKKVAVEGKQIAVGAKHHVVMPVVHTIKKM